MKSVDPLLETARSALYRLHQRNGATFVRRGGALVVSHYGDNDAIAARHLALVDLSMINRTGFKGSGTVAWLQQKGINLPARPNTAVRHSDGSIVGRLSQDEHIILADPGSNALPASVVTAHKDIPGRATAAGVYSLLRQHSHGLLALCGGKALEMMSLVCAVDLGAASFNDGDIAQTFVAEIGAIVIRADFGTVPGFYLLCESTATEYWWKTLLDAGQILGIASAGITALDELSKSREL